MSLRSLARCSVVVACIALLLGRAHTAAAEPEKPWEKGVSAEHRERALQFFRAGNEFFAQSLYRKALAQYRLAIAEWEHPSIRFNIAVCLINIDDNPLEAYENLTKGLAYGKAPLGDKLYAEGKTYMRLLNGRIVRLTVTVDEPGAKVTLDGDEVLVGPGSITRLVTAGKHQVVATKRGMLTDTRPLVLQGGKDRRLEITMHPVTTEMVMKRRWKVYKPWATVGAGAGMVVLGGVLYALAKADLNTYDARITELCGGMAIGGCLESVTPIPSNITHIERRGRIEGFAAGTLLIGGGLTAAAGVVLLYLNRQRPFPATAAPTSSAAPAVSIIPLVGGDRAGAVATWRF